MTILIARCIEDQRYVFLSCANANCDLVLITYDLLVGVLYLLNILGVKLLVIRFRCDFVCEIDFWNNLFKQLTTNCFGTQSHLVRGCMERIYILVPFEK